MNLVPGGKHVYTVGLLPCVYVLFVGSVIGMHAHMPQAHTHICFHLNSCVYRAEH